MVLVAPSVLSLLNRMSTRIGELLRCMASSIALGALFYCVVTPTGILMRLFEKDTLRLRLDKSAKSYWIERHPPGPAPASLKLPF